MKDDVNNLNLKQKKWRISSRCPGNFLKISESLLAQTG
jgi:hypothetical protein